MSRSIMLVRQLTHDNDELTAFMDILERKTLHRPHFIVRHGIMPTVVNIYRVRCRRCGRFWHRVDILVVSRDDIEDVHNISYDESVYQWLGLPHKNRCQKLKCIM